MFGGKRGIPELLVLMVLFWGPAMIGLVAAWWKISTNAGHPGPLSFTMLVPLVNLGVLLWFAFSTRPVERQAVQARPLA